MRPLGQKQKLKFLSLEKVFKLFRLLSPKPMKHDTALPDGTRLEATPKTGRNWNDGTAELKSSSGSRTNVRFCVIISCNGRGLFRSLAHCYIWTDIGRSPSSGRFVAMAYDFKKEFRELYKSSGRPSVVTFRL